MLIYSSERLLYSDRNWLEFLSVLDATFPSVATPDATSSSDDSSSRLQEVRELLDGIAAKDGLNDRSASLALLELEKRARTHGSSTGTLNSHTFQSVLMQPCRTISHVGPYKGLSIAVWRQKCML